MDCKAPAPAMTSCVCQMTHVDVHKDWQALLAASKVLVCLRHRSVDASPASDGEAAHAKLDRASGTVINAPAQRMVLSLRRGVGYWAYSRFTSAARPPLHAVPSSGAVPLYGQA